MNVSDYKVDRLPGSKIMLPEKMTYAEAHDVLNHLEAMDEKVVDIKDKIHGFVNDSAVGFVRALKEIFGFVDEQPTPGFFGPIDPMQLAVQISKDETIYVPIGQFGLPGIVGHVTTDLGRFNSDVIFVMTAKVKKKDEAKVLELFGLAKKYAKDFSCYRGKAFKISGLNDTNSIPTPEFLDLSKVDPNQLVFSEEVGSAVNTSIFTPLKNTEACRKARIPLKRGVLLAGRYGVGKTLTTYVTAKHCVENGWTFIYCESADELADVVRLAQQYQPAVVFCEDIDRVMSGERSLNMDDVLNIIDGVESKGTELMVIMTTNHVETINRALLRPGRLDAVINVLPPDAKAVERLLRMYGSGMIDADEDLTEVSEVMAGQIPAVIREVVERAKLARIGEGEVGSMLRLTGSSLTVACQSMKNQLDLMNADQVKSTKLEDAVTVLADTMNLEVRERLSEIKHRVDDLL